MNRLVFRFDRKRSGRSLSTDLTLSPSKHPMEFPQELKLRMEELMCKHALLHPGEEVLKVEAMMWDQRYVHKYRDEAVRVDLEKLQEKLALLADQGEAAIRGRLNELSQEIYLLLNPELAAKVAAAAGEQTTDDPENQESEAETTEEVEDEDLVAEETQVTQQEDEAQVAQAAA